MSQSVDTAWQEKQRLFSVVICLDETMRIVYCSPTVLRHLPHLEDNPLLSDAFNILRPGKLQTFSDAIAKQDSLCLMTATNGDFAIRGQLMKTTYKEQEVMCLCGAPWLFWMSSNCPDVRLSLSDFSSQDVQIDQLFFMTTEKIMVADLEQMNAELTEAKEELQEAQEAQHRLFAQMSHEMRTPLNGVVSALTLLEANHLDESQQQLIALAKSSSHNLMDVINYVLDLSKLELAGEDGEDAFDLHAMLRSSMDILSAKAREKALELAVDIGIDVPRYCSGNVPRLRQILLNLIMNAIKFTDHGSITLRVATVTGDAPDCTLKFSVIDTGIGIANEIQQKIFEPFWSLRCEGGDHPDAGTGLGLDIVRRNVENAGGTIGLTSEPGAGSTFWFDWPTVVVSATEITSQVSSTATDDGLNVDLSGKILLVDDNQTNLLLGAMIIESMGVDVTKAENGTEAVAAALEESFDLVLMDIHMPDFDGIEATRRIRKVKDAQTLPIVALTALAYDKEREACMATGMNGYLIKPIVRQALAEELGKWLGNNVQSPVTSSAEICDDNTQAAIALDELLDQAILDELQQQIGPENLKVVMTTVATEAAQRWEELVAADCSNDKAAVQRHVHSLSSIFRSVGLMPAGEALAATEALLRAGTAMEAGWIEALEPVKTKSLEALAQQLTAP